MALALAPIPALAQSGGAETIERIAGELTGDDGDLARISDDRLDALEKQLNAVIANKSNAAKAYMLRGLIAYRLGKLRSARADLEQSTRANPTSGLAWYNLGLTLERLGEWSSAREAYQKATARAPGLAAAHYNLGRLFQAAGDLKRAENAFFNASLTDPGSARVLTAMGNLRWLQGDYRTALIRYEEALARAPGSYIIRFNRALALESLARYEEARREFRELAAAHSQGESARLGWARCAYRLALWPQVEEALTPMLETKGSKAEMANRLLAHAKAAKTADEALLRRHGQLPLYSLEGPLYGPEREPEPAAGSRTDDESVR